MEALTECALPGIGSEACFMDSHDREIFDRLGQIGAEITGMRRDIEADRLEAKALRIDLTAKQKEQGEQISDLRRDNEHFRKQMQKVMPFIAETERWRQRGMGFASGIMFLGMLMGVFGAKYVTPMLEALRGTFK